MVFDIEGISPCLTSAMGMGGGYIPFIETQKKLKLENMRIGSDFSGVGAFEQALIRLGVKYTNVFACDMDKYVRETYIANYGEPDYYPKDVYERDIPEEPLDIYMTSPPCQAFSIAGKRGGEADKRGVLFYNSHEFICKNRPRYFIFENVKGLLSDDDGKTFQRWIDYLAKSVNGNPMIFPHEESAGYHVYHAVLNTKDYGVPQNRERVFIVGIRDDKDNSFRFPKAQHLTKKLKDILEDGVDEKFYLSDKLINGFMKHNDHHNEKGTGFIWQPKGEDDIATTLRANAALCPTDNTLKVKSATSKGYEEAKEGDSINLSQPNSKTRRGRVGKSVPQTLDTSCNQGVIAASRGRNPENSSDRTTGAPTQQKLEINTTGTSNALTSVQKDNLVVEISKARIRRLTPRECFRLQDFPDTFKMPCSDTQMYKQAGNSITVAVLYNILKNLI